MGPATKLLRTQSDARLAALTRDGHELAFEAIVERYRRPLLRGARRILPEARAEDAVQQAFLAAWRALRRGDEIRELKPWLYRIVQHTALNALRSRQRKPVIPLNVRDSGPLGPRPAIVVRNPAVAWYTPIT